MSAPPTHRRHAFTLVELLVVIGIIAMLISILLPTLSRARRVAKSVTCLSNLRQLAVASANYAAANRGEFQMTTYTIAFPNNDWESRFLQYNVRTANQGLGALVDFSLRDGILSQYLDIRSFQGLKVFECPEAIDMPHTTLPASLTAKYPPGTQEYDLLTNISYGTNPYLTKPFTNPSPTTSRSTRIRNASETIMFADSAQFGLGGPTAVSRSNVLSSPSGLHYASGGSLFHGRHPNGQGGVAWVDGHATLETVNAVDRPPSSTNVAAARIARGLGYIERDAKFVGNGSDPAASYYYLPTKGYH